MTDNEKSNLLTSSLNQIDFLIRKSNDYIFKEDADELETYKYLEELLSIKNKLEYLKNVTR